MPPTAVEFFLKIEGIDGESTDKVHKGEIDIASFSFGESQTATAGGGSGGGAGKVSIQDFHFSSKSVSKASPNLFLACATGKHFASATLTCRKAGGDHLEFLKIKLSDVLISSYSLGAHATDTGFSALGPGDNELVTDQFSLNFVRIEIIETAADGSITDVTFDQRG